MNKSERELLLEERIKELEGIVEYLQNQVNYKLDIVLHNMPPLTCQHEWTYNYNTTCPNRTCSKCYKYEMLSHFNGTFNSTAFLHHVATF